jgi:hypothetical protein
MLGCREELQQAAGSDAAVLSVEATWQWSVLVEVLRDVDGSEVSTSLAVAGGVLAAAFGLRTAWWSVAVVAFVLLSLELGVRLLLAWCARRSRQLKGSLQAFEEALEKFNAAYTASLTLVKRAELASRGYRLGAGLLPPIGRLEASDADAADDGGSVVGAALATKTLLRCLPLRRKLRAVSDELQFRASELLQEGEKPTSYRARTLGEGGADQAPSLLLTALAKQRHRTALLLETAVRTALVRELARACSPRSATGGDSSLLRVLRAQRLAAEQLAAALHERSDGLEAWNSTRDPVAMLAAATQTAVSEQKQDPDPSIGDPRVKGLAAQLQELRATSETLTALAIAAQHELLLPESAAERLSSCRAAMASVTQQLQEAWSNYNDALSALTGAAQNGPDVDEQGGQEREDRGAKPIAALASPSVPAPEDPSCTVVFTGTSTGDEGFDLQALLKQQAAEAAASSSGPTPHFVRELQAVLAHRQAHAQPGLTKQVDHDPPAPKTSSEVPAPPAADAMFAPPRAPPRGRPRRPPFGALAPPGGKALPGAVAAALNVELQSVLQRAPQQDFIGDSDEDSEVW